MRYRPRPSSDATSRASTRLLWADVAKGVTIFLVVLNHLTRKHYFEFDASQLGFAAGNFWYVAVDALNPIRMPLFFLLSGFFAASALKREWVEVAAKRVVQPYYLFTIWLALHGVYFSYERTLSTTRLDSSGEVLAQLLSPSSSLWFLYALSAYFALAYALMALRISPVLVTVLAAIAAVVAEARPAELIAPGWFTQNLPYFLIGAYFPEAVRRLAGQASAQRLLVLLGLYAGLTTAAYAPVAADVPGLLLVRSGLGLALGVTAIVLVTRASTSFAKVAAWIGERTLPIYVLHLPVLAVWHSVVTARGAIDLGPLAAVYPLLATMLVTAGCVAVHQALTRPSLACLFELPQLPPVGPLLAQAFSAPRLAPRFPA